MRVSDHFSDHEFFTPATYALLTESGRQPIWYISKELIYDAEVIRRHFKKKMYISSGIRTPEENSISKSPLSLHLMGKAIDFTVEGVPPEDVQEFCERKFDYGGLGCYPTFTHRDIRNSDKLIIWEG